MNTAGKVIAMDTATPVGYSFSSAESQGFAVPHAWTRMEPSHSKSIPTRSAWGLCA